MRRSKRGPAWGACAAGGVAGSAFGGWAYQIGGWNLVCAAGAATAVLGIVLWAAFAIGEREHSVQGVAAQQRLRGEVQAV